MPQEITIYDTTLRDGAQADDINFSLEDKLRIAIKLDKMGVHYIEGGWPGSNPKDAAFFDDIQKHDLKNAKVAAFGSTRHIKNPSEKDPNLLSLISSKADIYTIFGKSWDIHVTDALKISLNQNLKIISDSLSFLKKDHKQVFYDAEHFFDGFKANPIYAIKTLSAAVKGGADCLILCDTNGGSLPKEISKAVKQVAADFPGIPIGIHTHNDGGLATANTLAAVEYGATHVQGTINGFGERCGNANLCAIIPNLQLKLGYSCINQKQLESLSATARYVYEIANTRPNRYQPFVGRSAFAHKGGIHVSAIEKNPVTYEHIKPELVGNFRRVLISDQAGKANIINRAALYGFQISPDDPIAKKILNEIKMLENEGFQFDAAEASFELLMCRAMGKLKRYFNLIGFSVIDRKMEEDKAPLAEATIMVMVGEQTEHTASIGEGPVNALDNALRKALEKFYPNLRTMKLLDYKVRVLPGRDGTKSRVRVLIESIDGENRWGTVGVSHDILEASWQALVDSINYKLYMDDKKHFDD